MFIRAALLTFTLVALGWPVISCAQVHNLPQELKAVILKTAEPDTITAVREMPDFAHYRLSLAKSEGIENGGLQEKYTSIFTQKFGTPSRVTKSAAHWTIGKTGPDQLNTAILIARSAGYLEVIIDARSSAGANNPRQFKLTARAKGKPVKIIQPSKAAVIVQPSLTLRD